MFRGLTKYPFDFEELIHELDRRSKVVHSSEVSLLSSYSFQITFIGKSKAIDMIGFRVDPLTKLLRCLRKRDPSCDQSIDQNVHTIHRYNAIGMFHWVVKDLHIH